MMVYGGKLTQQCSIHIHVFLSRYVCIVTKDILITAQREKNVMLWCGWMFYDTTTSCKKKEKESEPEGEMAIIVTTLYGYLCMHVHRVKTQLFIS